MARLREDEIPEREQEILGLIREAESDCHRDVYGRTGEDTRPHLEKNNIPFPCPDEPRGECGPGGPFEHLCNVRLLRRMFDGKPMFDPWPEPKEGR